MRKYFISECYSYDSRHEMDEHRKKMLKDGWKADMPFTNEDGSEICVEYHKHLD